ncbi:MAG: preprotein translocase subunit YajC [Candidatus Omnitrophota bacterium]|nr:preprotein translocase subunit YajC [Candidatus Omnitrophota bacterium]
MPNAAPVNPLLASPIVPIALMFIFLYFIVIKPQKKQEKQRKDMLGNLVKNQDIVTSGGIHGTIVNVKDKSVIVRIDDNVKVEVEKSCVAHIVTKVSEGKES